jgi:hypothetical protein
MTHTGRQHAADIFRQALDTAPPEHATTTGACPQLPGVCALGAWIEERPGELVQPPNQILSRALHELVAFGEDLGPVLAATNYVLRLAFREAGLDFARAAIEADLLEATEID